ncbi:TPA: type 1 glutamine amidotransferase-like domain-containing protein [Candidatus Woesearchaeota archaeon]|nr:type 1 glutamine amidotransferase-like domain-containing protein [Candidatus Woesearchaeota archaeon]
MVLDKKLSNMDVIFVSGGNTFYLLEVMKKSGFDKIIKTLLAKEIVYVGSSAGSCVVAPDITPIKLLDDPKKAKSLKSYTALNLTRTLVLPHLNTKKFGARCLATKKKYEKKYDMTPLNDNQVLIVKGNKNKIMKSSIKLSLIKSLIYYKIRKKLHL